MNSAEKHSRYCTTECPIGKPTAERLLQENNSAIAAALDMQEFVEECAATGCSHEAEKTAYGAAADRYGKNHK